MADHPYILSELRLSGFRAFLEPHQFDFKVKRCLAVFAPNGKGKSSIVDALEFMFSGEGTLTRLGLRAVNNRAGVTALAHVLAEEKGIDSFVSVAFTCGTEKLDGSRNASAATRPMPAVAEVVGACFVAEPLIRGHELRGFVEERTAEKRYEMVACWLNLGPLVDIQHNLRMLRQRCKAAADDTGPLGRVDTGLARVSGGSLSAWDHDAVVAYANGVLAQLDGQLTLGSLDRADPGFALARDRQKAEERGLGLEGLRLLRRAATVLYEEQDACDGADALRSGFLLAFEDAVEAQALAQESEATERRAASDAVFAELWKAAEPLFAEGAEPLETCPLCNTPLAVGASEGVEGVRNHIARHRSDLARYATAREQLEDATATVCSLQGSIGNALEVLGPLLSEEFADAQAALADYVPLVTSWNSGEVPEAGGVKEALVGLLAAVDGSIKSIEAEHGENTYRRAVARLEEIIDLKCERDGAVRLLTELKELSIQLDTQASFVTSQIRQHVQALLNTLQEPLNEIYRQIQGAEAVPIRLELPPADDTNQHRLNLLIDFAPNRPSVQPAGYLSDSQIHSLALALRLAAIKLFNTVAPLVVLDDIVTSYDADHRRLIAAMLAMEFADFQVIVTTHDERFFVYLKDQLGDKHWQYARISGLEPDSGPRFLDHRVTDEMIEQRWQAGESAANEMRQAEEEWLLALCRDFGVDVRIRSVERAYSYERSELAAALAGFIGKKGCPAPMVPGVNNRFLTSLQQGLIENFGSHFQDGPYGDGSDGDEQARWAEFKFFCDLFVCPQCGGRRFKRPVGMNMAVCAKEGCEVQFAFADPGSSSIRPSR